MDTMQAQHVENGTNLQAANPETLIAFTEASY